MFSPNATQNNSAPGYTACAERACLFNIALDPNEHTDLADDPRHKAKAAELLAKFATFDSTSVTPPLSQSDAHPRCLTF